MSETPFDISEVSSSIDMNEIVKDHNILFICLDTLRYDVAKKAEQECKIPTLNKYGKWEECIAAGNFTYPSHHTMFIGFLPAPKTAKSITDRELLFFPKNIGLGNKSPKNAFLYEGENFIQGLANIDYHTLCIGGVAFFDKRSDIGKIFPNMFIESHWQPKFGCVNKDSAKYQVDYAIKCIERVEKKVFCYINFSAIHYPNFHYATDEKNSKKDDLNTHQLALEYVDSTLEPLFNSFKNKGKTFVIVTSDHGTCYGEDGYNFHGINHENVNTVPYKHFFL